MVAWPCNRTPPRQRRRRPFSKAFNAAASVWPQAAETQTIEIYRGVIPFVAIQIVALFILASFPGLATWFPSVVFG